MDYIQIIICILGAMLFIVGQILISHFTAKMILAQEREDNDVKTIFFLILSFLVVFLGTFTFSLGIKLPTIIEQFYI